MTPASLPEGFTRRVEALHGETGRRWLERLPGLINRLAQAWGIRIGSPFDGMQYNFVAPAVGADGTQLVLKVGVSGPAIEREVACLEHFGGVGAPRLLSHDPIHHAFLMERVLPGTNLIELPEADAIRAVVQVMDHIHKRGEPAGVFPDVAKWGEGFSRHRERHSGGGPIPERLLFDAEATFQSLESSMVERVLLHGDLHHANVVSAGRLAWLAIDPQGVIGEPVYEIGAFLRNPTPALGELPNLVAVLDRRIRLFARETGLDPGRIAGWGFAQAVLSAVWSIEDHDEGWHTAVAVARALRLTGAAGLTPRSAPGRGG